MLTDTNKTTATLSEDNTSQGIPSANSVMNSKVKTVLEPVAEPRKESIDESEATTGQEKIPTVEPIEQSESELKNHKNNQRDDKTKGNEASVKKVDIKGSIISAGLIIALTAACLFLWNDTIKVGATALTDSYATAYESEKESAYKKLYEAAYERAEKKYHVSNTVVISIGNLEESEKLEVLKATDVEFITENSDKNSGNVTAWLEVTGQGTFVIDLKAAEFIINNEQRNVLVRLPNPELTNITITNSERKLFKDDLFNGSYREGVTLAIKQRNEASLQIQKSLMANQYIYSNAQDVSKSMVANLVNQFNPDIPDLTVDVEFMD